MGNGKGRKEIYTLCACGLAAVMLAACGGQEEEEPIVVIEQEQVEASYLLAVADKGDVEKTEEIRATYRQSNQQEVSFPISGRLVDKVYVREGDTVKKGDLLVELSAGDLDRKIEDLEYKIARNQLLLDYTDTDEEYAISALWVNYLYYSGMSEWEKKNLDSRIESVQQNYEYLREDYSDALEIDQKELENLKQERIGSRIYAELDGVVSKVVEDLEGTTSQKDQVIMTILDTTECFFETEAPELAEYFHEGETVSLTLNYGTGAGDYELLPWHMEEWGDIQLFVVYEGPEGASIEVGTSGNMEIVTDKKENVLRVPVSAVNSADGRNFVYVLDENNLREVRWVEIGLYGDDMVEILDGLEEGEKVIRKW